MTPRPVFTTAQATLVFCIDTWLEALGLPAYSALLSEAAPIDPDALPPEIVFLDHARDEAERRRAAAREARL